MPSVRRVFLDNSEAESLRRRVARADVRIKALEEQQEVLMKQSEKHMAASRAHAHGEKDWRLKAKEYEGRLDKALEDLRKNRHDSKTALEQTSEERESLRRKYSSVKLRLTEAEAK